jgi:hypothetical protein
LAVAVGYALTITTASLFHDHGSHDGVRCCHGHSLAHAASKHCTGDESDQSPGHRNAPRAPARCPGDDGRCSVCQFLGQKPIPAAEVTTVVCGTLVQEVSAPAPARGVVRVFSAWQSRAPPAA